MKNILFLLAAVTVSITSSGAVLAEGQTSTIAKEATAPAAPAKQSSGETGVKETLLGLNFEMKLPAEFTEKKVSSLGTSEAVIWAAPRGPGERRPVVVISVNREPVPDEIKSSEIVGYFLDGQSKSWTKFTRSPVKEVVISGQSFSVVEFEAEKADEKAYGVVYLTVSNKKGLVVEAQDPDPTKKSLKQVEACVQSFKFLP